MAKSEQFDPKEGNKLHPEERLEELKAWLVALDDVEPATWDQLPDIGLYMDQVLTLMDRQFALYKRSDDDRLITPSMINNYTKDGVLPRVSDKKYAQEHLALIALLCELKPVLSIADLSVLLNHMHDEEGRRACYNYYLDVRESAVKGSIDDVNQYLSRAGDEPTPDVFWLSLKLAIEARMRILIAQRILTLVRGENEKSEKIEKEKKDDAT